MNQKKKIAIIGAAGYVGIEVVKQFQSFKDEFEVYAITRSNGLFLLNNFDVIFKSPKDLDNIEKMDFVINLAYPSHFYLYPQQNEEIINQIKKLSSPDTIIIQISTQAIFGFEFDSTIVPELVSNKRDVSYVESKLGMENLVASTFKNNPVHIIRLGNVWGPGSGTWTAEVINKLSFGQPIGIQGKDGFSNITDVVNIASYIIHLVKSNSSKRATVHHLAEFSQLRWRDWVSFLEKELKVKAVYEDEIPGNPESLRREFVSIFGFLRPGILFKTLIGTRYLGSYVRSLVRSMGYQRYERFKSGKKAPVSKGYGLGALDLLYIGVFSTQIEFKSVISSDWKPVVSFEQSCENVKKWMSEVGYI